MQPGAAWSLWGTNSATREQRVRRRRQQVRVSELCSARLALTFGPGHGGCGSRTHSASACSASCWATWCRSASPRTRCAALIRLEVRVARRRGGCARVVHVHGGGISPLRRPGLVRTERARGRTWDGRGAPAERDAAVCEGAAGCATRLLASKAVTSCS